jgi:hypothetical protein
MHRLAILCAVATAVVAVGPLQAGATTPISPKSYVSQVVSIYEQMAAIVHKDGRKCGKMAADLVTFTKSHKAQLAALNATTPKISKTTAATIVMADGGKFAQAATTIGQGLAACSSNKSVQQMFAALNKLTK